MENNSNTETEVSKKEKIRHFIGIEKDTWVSLNKIAKDEEFIPVNSLIIKLINQRIALSNK